MLVGSVPRTGKPERNFSADYGVCAGKRDLAAVVIVRTGVVSCWEKSTAKNDGDQSLH